MNLVPVIMFCKALVCAAAIALVFIFRLYDLGKIQAGRRGAMIVLVALAGIALPAYLDFGHYPKHGRFMNPHDFFHYYLGSKYWNEVGYFDLYRCVIIADTENTGQRVHKSLRDLNTYRTERAKDVLGDAAEYRSRFSTERWHGFKKDVAYFREITIEKRWLGVVRDKGYNATPAWNMVASRLTNFVDTADHGRKMWVLVALDLCLLSVMLLLVRCAFGTRVMLFLTVYFGVHFSMAFPHIRGAFLRLDWVTLLVMACCLLKLGRHKTAGALVALAGMARMFPFVFAFGIGAKFVWELISNRKLNRQYFGFLSMLALVTAVVALLTVVNDGGTDHWKAFLQKIRLHDNDLSPSRVGFKYLFLGTYGRDGQNWQAFEDEEIEEFKQRRVLWWSLQAVALVACFIAVRRLEDYETIPLGYVLMFFLTAPTFYYQVALIVPFLMFMPKISQFGRAIGAASMFGLTIMCYALLEVWKLDLKFSYVVSCALLAVGGVLLVTGLLAKQAESESTSSLQV